MKKIRKECRNINFRKIQEDILADILKLISIQSFTYTDGIQKCQEVIVQIAEKLGFVTKLLGKQKVIVIEPKFAKEIPELGIITHLDTVSFKKEDWSYNPLGEIFENRIYGRGVIDDKSAIVLALYAFYLLGNNIRPSWQILVGSSEEGNFEDFYAYFEEKHPLPKFSITIDGDGIQNGSKGYVDFKLEFLRNSKTKQLTEFYVPNATNNTIPNKALATINGSTIETYGISCHSSIPEKGENALIHLASFAKKYTNSTEFSDFFELMEILKKTYNGASIGFKNHPDTISNQYVGYTSITPTNCTLNGDILLMNINCRLCMGTTMEEIEKVSREISSKFHCKCYYDYVFLPTYICNKSREIQLLLNSYTHALGKKTKPTISSGIGYNAIFPNCVIFGPRFASQHDESDLCHAINESRRISDLFTFFRMLSIFCKDYLSK